MKPYLLAVIAGILLAFAACAPVPENQYKDANGNFVTPTPVPTVQTWNYVILTAAGDRFYCEGFNQETRVATDCVDIAHSDVVRELHLGPGDTWGKGE